tara:strand:- start:377 stop:616 length:240 start_codon:yes stop_codon:yes gene_type:complete
MKITKRQLRKIIAEEKAKIQEMQMTDSGQAIYDDVNERAIALAEEVLNNYGSDDIAIEAIVDALTDAAQTIMTDASLMR